MKKTLKAIIAKGQREPQVFSFNVPHVPGIHVAPRISIHHKSTTYGLMLEELNSQLGEYFGAPSRQSNLLLHREGTFSYDHVVRAGEELGRTIWYVLRNPVKAGLIDSGEMWKWGYVKEGLI